MFPRKASTTALSLNNMPHAGSVNNPHDVDIYGPNCVNDVSDSVHTVDDTRDATTCVDMCNPDVLYADGLGQCGLYVDVLWLL